MGGRKQRLTFREGIGVAVHLQGVQGADLQLGVVVQELLHDGFEGQQQLFLLLQLLFGGGRQLLIVLHHAQLLRDVLEETGESANAKVTENCAPSRLRDAAFPFSTKLQKTTWELARLTTQNCPHGTTPEISDVV